MFVACLVLAMNATETYASTKSDPVIVGFTAQAGSFPVVSSGQAATIVYDVTDAQVVSVVSNAFSNDVKAVTGQKPVVTNTLPSTGLPVIIGTLGKSSFINQLASAGKINTDKVRDKWETFCITIVNNPLPGIDQALVIYGSDPRGTAFGVFELSRMMGVSPWVWWADVTPKKHESIFINTGHDIIQSPSVQYRGFFINDEDWAIQPWAAKNMDPEVKNMGPKTYEKIFELMLRLKANYLWPAMHSCTKAFWYYPANPAMARKYSIVLGSSHCEQMLRDNLDEWVNNYATEYGKAPGDWNWGSNNGNIKTYWADRVKQSKNNDAIYTLGMRGIHDSGIPGYNTDEERKVALIDIIHNQRNMFEPNLGKPANQVPQLFCPYKEVLPIYKLGINLADDVTLLWADDNFGFMRQLSNPTEQQRSGGGGVYYHFSYLGPPQSYLWVGSTPPAVAAYELKKAYELNCKKIWMFNAGDIKPLEFELQFALDLAWDINSVDLENPIQYAQKWGAEIFGEEFGESIYNIKKEYFRLAASGKPENISSTAYSVAEMENRIKSYDKLVTDVQALETRIPADLQDAFYQLIKYPVEGSAAMNTKILGAKLSFEYGARGDKDEALDIASTSTAAFQKIIDLTDKYNKQISNGKWDGMMSYSPNGSGYFYDAAVVSAESIKSNSLYPKVTDSIKVISAGSYASMNNGGLSFKKIEGLGVSDNAMTIWPLNMVTYTASNIASAPYLEYSVSVLKGTNTIDVRCLPTFALYQGQQLRYAISVDNAAPVFVDIQAVLDGETSAAWSQNVLQGYSHGVSTYESSANKTISVKIYFADPGVVLSALHITNTGTNPLTELIINSNFELKSEGVVNDGTTFRGVPYGWNQSGTLIGNSFGINSDAINKSGNNACWFSSIPMPAKFQLFQTIRNLPAGEYIVRCRLAVFSEMLTNVRLFANNNVQYYGLQANYISNLTQGEMNTYANWLPEVNTGIAVPLHEMAVKVSVFAGDSLKLGICSSNLTSNGTQATNNSGWFKVDYFRLERISLYSDQNGKAKLDSLLKVANDLYSNSVGGITLNEYPISNRNAFNVSIQSSLAVYNNNAAAFKEIITSINNLEIAIENYRTSIITANSYIINPGFEYKSKGVLNDGTTFRGTPYGWKDTGGINGNSFGINNDALNLVGNNSCWYLSTPMPKNFELSQTIRGLPAGEYKVTCRMAVMDGKFTTQRLFANNSVQYFGKESDYGQNIVEGETKSYAGWTSTNARFLKDMSVTVVIHNNDSLKIGVRLSNIKANGQTSVDDSGWFKVDNFNIELKRQDNENTGVIYPEAPFINITWLNNKIHINTDVNFKLGQIKIYSLIGNLLLNKNFYGKDVNFNLTKGIYLANVSLDGITKSNLVIAE